MHLPATYQERFHHCIQYIYYVQMEQLKGAINSMIDISTDEMDIFLSDCYTRTYKRKEFLNDTGKVCNDVFFINSGTTRNVIIDNEGIEHTIHFSIEHQFISEYSSFLQKTPAKYSVQALENTEVIIMPRSAVEWAYSNLKNADKMGRIIAEYYFIYLDNRINNLYTQSPVERYINISQLFPDIHNRAPQHMIASYLGITPVHLSRLKKELLNKT